MSSTSIALLTVSLAPGGAETVVAQLASALRVSGWDVTVLTMLDPTAFQEELESIGVSVVSLGMRRGRANLRGVFRLLSHLRRSRPDLLHSHMFHANILARLARLLLGIPIVSTVHSEIECSHRKKSAGAREWLYRLTNAVGGRITVVSERVRDRYVRKRIIPADRVEIVGNGVDLDRMCPEPGARAEARVGLGWGDRFIWLAAGRLELAKDYPTLIRAFELLREKWPAARLAIAGEGRLREEIERQIHEASLGHMVSLLGWRDDIPLLMNASDALVMSSSWEGAQLAVLEASAAGRPVVATAVGIAPQAVIPGKTGLLVPANDARALAEAMQRIMALPAQQRDEMGCEARLHMAREFSLQSVLAGYLRVYSVALRTAR